MFLSYIDSLWKEVFMLDGFRGKLHTYLALWYRSGTIGES